MSLLSILQSVYVKVLSSRPTAGASSTDPKIIQAIEYINEAGQELAHRYPWQVLTNESTFTSTNTEVQGTTIQALTGPGFSYIINNTMWNRSQRRPVPGPLSDSQWQLIKAQFVQGPWSQYRVRANQLLFLPAPPDGQTIAFEWCSSQWCTNAGGAPQTAFLADSDVSLLSERVITLDALWRFKRANKLSYDEDFDKAEQAIEDLMTRDGSKSTINMDGYHPVIDPGVFVPAGNWGL